MPYKPLNKNITPTHYSLHFVPDFLKPKDPSFIGHVAITIDVHAPVSEMVLNQKGLEVSSVSLQYQGKQVLIPQKNIKHNPDDQTVSICFGKTIQPGKGILSMDFSGKLGAGEGLYCSMYEGKKGKEYILTTQMEPAFARQAFPCVDEPAAKATFDTTVTIDERIDALSNTLPIAEKKLRNGKKQITFAKTPRMATYLFYLGAGKFDYLTDKYRDIIIRVITMPGKAEQGTFALDAAKKFLTFYETYFEIPYPLPKLDLIAVPDFAMGAMENWGAITYRETSLLYNEKTSSLAEKQRVAEVVSHELVHQWFGNLATMKWWNDLWLNESFADFMAHKAIEVFFPELEPWSQFLQASQNAYSLDALKSSHPINIDVKTPEEIDEIFDAISYQKGGMVLRMLESFLGEDIFKKGLHRYLSQFSYANAEGKDLWNALEKASGKPVGKIMDSWLNQTGYPVVSVEKEKNTLLLSQRRFLYAGSVSGIWTIPLTLTMDNTTTSCLMDKKKTSITVAGKHTWIKINAQEAGFYLVKYASDMLPDLEQVISTKELGNIDRWGIHNDASALCIATEMPLQEYLHLLESYHNEDDYLVLIDIARSLEKFTLYMYGEKGYPRVAAAATQTYNAILSRLGWEPKEGEKRTDMQIRAAVLAGLGMLNDSVVREKTQEMFQTFLKDKTAVHPDLRGAMYAIAAWHGTEKTYQQLLELHRKEESQAEKNRLLRALASFQDKTMLTRTLDMMFQDEVKMQDAYLIPITLSSHPIGKLLVWSWLQKHWNKVKEQYVGVFVPHLSSIIKSLSTMADADAGKQIKQFLEKQENHVKGTERAIANMAEMMEINDKFLGSVRKEFAARR